MAERRRPTPEDAMKKAEEVFQRRRLAPKYAGRDALQRALESIQRTGARLKMTPGELYTNLAELSAKAAEAAQQHGQESDAQVFTDQQRILLQVTGSGLIVPPTGLILPASVSPSNPLRTTGRAAG